MKTDRCNVEWLTDPLITAGGWRAAGLFLCYALRDEHFVSTHQHFFCWSSERRCVSWLKSSPLPVWWIKNTSADSDGGSSARGCGLWLSLLIVLPADSQLIRSNPSRCDFGRPLMTNVTLMNETWRTIHLPIYGDGGLPRCRKFPWLHRQIEWGKKDAWGGRRPQ